MAQQPSAGADPGAETCADTKPTSDFSCDTEVPTGEDGAKLDCAAVDWDDGFKLEMQCSLCPVTCKTCVAGSDAFPVTVSAGSCASLGRQRRSLAASRIMYKTDAKPRRRGLYDGAAAQAVREKCWPEWVLASTNASDLAAVDLDCMQNETMGLILALRQHGKVSATQEGRFVEGNWRDLGLLLFVIGTISRTRRQEPSFPRRVRRRLPRDDEARQRHGRHRHGSHARL